jgi:hypothetical protein
MVWVQIAAAAVLAAGVAADAVTPPPAVDGVVLVSPFLPGRPDPVLCMQTVTGRWLCSDGGPGPVFLR